MTRARAARTRGVGPRLLRVCVLFAAGGCGHPDTVTVSGRVFDFDTWLGGVIGGQSTTLAFDAAVVGGATVTLAEDANVRALDTSADGRYRMPGAPWGVELHPIVRRYDDDHVASEDGLGIQYPEVDIPDWPLAIIRAGGDVVRALAAGFGTDELGLVGQGFQLYAIFDRPFPAGALVRDGLAISLNTGRWLAVGWDAGKKALVTRFMSIDFDAGQTWLGLVAITDADEAAHLTMHDQSGRPAPRLYVQHPYRLQPLRAQIFLLPPVNP